MSRNDIFERLLGLPRRSKQAIMALADGCAAIFTLWVAYSLRFEKFFVPYDNNQIIVFALAPALAVPIFVRCGLYRAIFRYSGFGATAAIARATAIYAVAFAAIILALSLREVPRSVAVLQSLLFAWSVLAMRSFGGVFLGGRRRSDTSGQPRKRILIFGAGVSGIQTLNGLRNSPDYGIIGFIDDDPKKVGREIQGLPVLGRESLSDLVRTADVQGVLLAMPNLSRPHRVSILEWLRPFALQIRSIPSVQEIASGKVRISEVRELDIEDLLGRTACSSMLGKVMEDLFDRVVLVSGAGGSIGSELCRQILNAKPAKLILVESNEFALYNIEEELSALAARDDIASMIVPVLADVRHAQTMQNLLADMRPSVIYHAAAYKHVPLVESNIAEGVRNNVLGTLNIARAAILSGTARFVLISTDKAVRPTNVMGASKRLAEVVLQALAGERTITFDNDAPAVVNKTVFTMVRFGNVLGSSGSVVPLFRRQISAGGPVTVTHADVTRFFMTIPEAAQLVLESGFIAKGGEVFLLDMGEPVKIIDLARRTIELSGASVRDDQNPDGDIEIVITGLRPGEKLYEELLIGDNPMPTSNPRIMQAREHMWGWDIVRAHIDDLETGLDNNDLGGIRTVLADFVDGFASTHAPQDRRDMLSKTA